MSIASISANPNAAFAQQLQNPAQTQAQAAATGQPGAAEPQAPAVQAAAAAEKASQNPTHHHHGGGHGGGAQAGAGQPPTGGTTTLNTIV
jgi:hypothetical protein